MKKNELKENFNIENDIEKNIGNKENENEIDKNINYVNTNIFSYIFFGWTKKILSLSNEGNLKINDISAVSEEQSCKYNIMPLKKYWEIYSKKNYRYPLFISIFKTITWNLLVLIIFEMGFTLLDYVRMFFFRKILQNFSEQTFDSLPFSFSNIKNLNFDLYQSTLIFMLTRFIGILCHNHLDFYNDYLKSRIKNEMTALIHEKILLNNPCMINNSNREEGEILNLINSDCEKMGFIFFFGPKVLVSPIRVFIALYFLFKLFGKAFIYGILILIFLLIIILFLQYKYLQNLKILLNKKDKRSKLVTFIFHIIKNIKIYGYEELFENKIKKKRNKELLYQTKNLYISLVRMLINQNMHLILLIVSLSSYVIQNNNIDITNLFTANQLIGSLCFPLMGIPMFLTEFMSNLISVDRIQKYLNQPDHNYTKHEDRESFLKDNILIDFQNLNFGLKNSNNDSKNNKDLILLNNINLKVKKGEFIIILGTTGSGKTCLINSILNNFEILNNSDKNIKYIINGEISYNPQINWIMNDTIRNNILFFNKYDEKKYTEILAMCNLLKDLQDLIHGDLTEINLNGTNVSGGQRARICLARCLYRDADLYLLDNPLANIDNKISNDIFIKAFTEYLKDKTRILITNDINNLHYADRIIYMKKGEIIFDGDFDNFSKKYGNNNFNIQNNDDKKKDKEFDIDRKQSYEQRINKIGNLIRDSNKNLIQLKKEINIEHHEFENNPLFLMNNKKMKKGKISYSTYKTYITLQGGIIIFLLLIFLIIFSRFIDSYRRIYITSISRVGRQRIKINENIPQKNITNLNSINKDKINNKNDTLMQKNTFFEKFSIYIYISLLGMVLNILIEFIVNCTTINSLRSLHEIMINRLLLAPINTFHDIVPIGQILQRLTRDVESVQRIIRSVTHFFRSIIMLMATIYICYLYNKQSIIASPLLIICVYILSKFYVKGARNLQRVHRLTLAPIITILSETFNGVELIRTTKNEENMRNKIYEKLDTHFGAKLYEEGAKKWYHIRLRYLANFFYGIIIIYIVYNPYQFSSQSIALILQYTQDLSMELAMFLTTYTNIELAMVSLERCESITKIQTEKIIDIKDQPVKVKNSKNNEDELIDIWPNKGEIEIKNFSIKYRENLPIILNDINIKINAKEKIGIVGRTGSGKSSLVMSLCRIIESDIGEIIIDNVDIRKLNLQFLRQNITIVPQDIFLMEGTLKENIDPLNKKTENEIIEILNKYSIFPEITDNNERLNFYIKQNGDNLSIGQKQLICFARAGIIKSKILILDEATSYVDLQTEKIIKTNLENDFRDSTVIIIAHHIQMVSHCEKILVIDDGKIVEIDTYDNLLNNKNSKFYALYNESLAN